MSVSAVLDVAFGLSFVFLLFSLAVSRLNETIASALSLRHKGLENAVEALVGNDDDEQLSAQKVLGHDLIKPIQAAAQGLFQTSLKRLGLRRQGISYLPARTFSAAVLDILAPAEPLDPQQVLAGITADGLPAAAQSALVAAKAQPNLTNVEALAAEPLSAADLARVQALIAELRNDPLQQARTAVSALSANNPARKPLMRMLADAQGDRDRFRLRLEHWYDDTMDRVSGWYKRYVQRIIILISIVLVVGLNVDSINIAQALWRLPTERAAVASAAAASAGAGSNASQNADQQIQAISALKLPLGWTPPHTGSALSTDPQHVPLGPVSWLIKFLGMILTVLALSLGAPFWFDALSRLGSLRQSGPKPATSAHA
jgi:hypothetical protein